MIVTWSTGGPAAHLAERIFTDVGASIRRHPWLKARARLMVKLLAQAGMPPPSTVLDAGCGWGVTLQRLEYEGYRVDGVDVSRQALCLLDAGHRTLIEADLTQPYPARAIGAYDALLALDIIEHVDDDRALLGSLARLLRTRGVAIVAVPALPELYSEFDRVQGHRRRYVPHTLHQAFEDSDLTVERLFWWGSWMVPVLRLQRRTRRRPSGESDADIYRRYMEPPAWPLPLLMAPFFLMDEQLASRGLTWTGTSLVAVARKT